MHTPRACVCVRERHKGGGVSYLWAGADIASSSLCVWQVARAASRRSTAAAKNGGLHAIDIFVAWLILILPTRKKPPGMLSLPNCSAGFPILVTCTRFCFHAGRLIAEKTEVMPARQLETRDLRCPVREDSNMRSTPFLGITPSLPPSHTWPNTPPTASLVI